MKRKIYVALVVGILITLGIGSITPLQAADPVDPPLAAFQCHTNGPWEAWEGDTIDFVASGYGGFIPYKFRWDFGDGTPLTEWSEDGTEEHAYNNIEGRPDSADEFTVTLYGEDDVNPPHEDTDVDYAYVYKDFDLEAIVYNPGYVKIGDDVRFDCEAINQHWEYPYVVPDKVNGIYSWVGRCTIYKSTTRLLIGPYEYVQGYNHEPYNPFDYDIDYEDNEDWETPIWIPNYWGWHKVTLCIEEARHDGCSGNDESERFFYVFPF